MSNDIDILSEAKKNKAQAILASIKSELKKKTKESIKNAPKNIADKIGGTVKSTAGKYIKSIVSGKRVKKS